MWKGTLWGLHFCFYFPACVFTECSCDRQGTDVTRCLLGSPCLCDQVTGQCPCRRGVEGIRCDRCKDGYWNLGGNSGCQPCNCHTSHSVSNQCDKVTLFRCAHFVVQIHKDVWWHLHPLDYLFFLSRLQASVLVKQDMVVNSARIVQPIILETLTFSAYVCSLTIMIACQCRFNLNKSLHWSDWF